MRTPECECVLVIDRESPHSPLFPDRLCIEGVMYQGVVDFMRHREPQHLLEAMMAKYSQHIYLQKVFQQQIRLVHAKSANDAPWMTLVDDVYAQCKFQYRSVVDATEVSNLLTMCDGDTRPDWIARATYFSLAQPACGRDRAAHLSRLWLDKRKYRKRYDPSIEDELALYDVPNAFDLI